MSDSIRLPRGRRDDNTIMPSKYDSLEFKANNSFVSSQTFNLVHVPHLAQWIKRSQNGHVAKIGHKSSLLFTIKS